ncbi:MAG: hypothetical protein ABI556_02780 [Gemmatimonadales bacterium]
MLSKLGIIFAGLVLLATGILGLIDGPRSFADTTTQFEKIVASATTVYAVLALAALAGFALRRTWSVPVTIAWAVLVIFVGSTAALAYAPDSASATGAILAGVMTTAIAWVVLIGVRARLRVSDPVSRGQSG